jgi:hypothetical protein
VIDESHRAEIDAFLIWSEPDDHGMSVLIAEAADDNHGNSEANALLIVAAPDLLAACKEALTCIRQAREDEEGPFGSWPLEEQLEQAIDRAEGRGGDK